MAETDDLRAQIDGALDNENIPHIYFNSFINSSGTGDVTLVLKRNNRAVAVLNTSYTMAKTLAQKMAKMVDELERLTGKEIMTAEYIAEKARQR